jgi:hypothetical protein
MNNTTTLALAAILAATLVVGIAGTVTTTTAFAARSNNNNNNGNTVTIEECKNKGSASGFDTTVDQECENLICTHPGSGATCVSENEGATTTTPVTPATGTLLVKKEVVCETDTIKTRQISTCPPPGEFTITVTGNHPDRASFSGSETGTLVTLGVGSYKVSEDELRGFEVSFSGDCNANGDGTIAAGDHQTCTVTNTEKQVG